MNRQPQYPAKCVLPSEDTKEARARRRLGEGISKMAAEEACSHNKNEVAKEACISDVIAMDDLEIASKITY